MENIELLKSSNKLMGLLNDNFRCITNIALDKKNYIRIKGVFKKNRTYKHYIIVNNSLLQIINCSKSFTFQLNGQAGSNCKNIIDLDCDLDINQFKYEFMKHFRSNI